MRKSLLITLSLSALLLSACQNDSAQNTEESTNENTETTQQSESTTSTESSSAESTSQGNDEVTEYTYYFDDLYYVRNMDENADEKLVLLTFDDAPYGNALEIADTLEEHGAYGMFFVNGMYLDEEGSAIVEELHNRGHEIANHTETHQTLTEASEELQYDEIITTNEKIEEITGEPVRFFRAPHGMMTDYSEALVAEEGMKWVNWSFGYDWMPEYQNAEALADVTLNGNEADGKLLGPGSNILMHDRTWTADALPAILDGLEEQGFTIVDPKAITHEAEQNMESVESENE